METRSSASVSALLRLRRRAAIRLPSRMSFSAWRSSCGCCGCHAAHYVDAPAFFIPLAAHGCCHIDLCRVVQRSGRGLSTETAGAVPLVPIVYDLVRGASAPLVVQVIISGRSAPPSAWCNMRPALRQLGRRPGLAGALHDLLRAVDAGDVRRRRAPRSSPASARGPS